jgi:hypothetical protein
MNDMCDGERSCGVCYGEALMTEPMPPVKQKHPGYGKMDGFHDGHKIVFTVER